MKFFLTLVAALLATTAFAAPPAIDIPPEVRPSGQYVSLSPKTEAAAITYIGLSEVEPIPSAALKDPRMFLLDTRGLAQGRYRFVAVASLNDEHSRIDFVVVVGTPPVVIVPPGPTPNPQPGPQPTPTPAGQRTITIIREAHDQTSQFGDLIRDLRSGEADKYFRDKGHQLLILDTDQKGSDGRPTPLVQQWASVIGSMQKPVMIIHDSKTRDVLTRESLSPTLADPNVILEAVRKAGG